MSTAKRSICPLTSRALGVLLDVLALLDELVRRAGKSALHGSAQLRRKARGDTGSLSRGEHREQWFVVD